MSEENSASELFPKSFSGDPIVASALVDQIRSGIAVDDSEFDKIFPIYYQIQSPVHWTSIRVARQISELIKPLNLNSIVDIGCGVGKLCVLLRLLTDYEVFGIEQRANLVNIGKTIILANAFQRIAIKEMNMLDLDWDAYDIYYLYNPFQEHLSPEYCPVIDSDIELDLKHYVQYTSEVFRQLTWARPGKICITFHGYGGKMPSKWIKVSSQVIENGQLAMWIKE